MLIKIYDYVGDFGEDKDIAAELRDGPIKRTISSGRSVTVDFAGVSLVTQSFAHALISDVLRTQGESALDQLEFKNCAVVVQGIISTVVQYSLDTIPQITAEQP